jgi:hypothetical protein
VDAPINPGNSGGPVVNDAAQVIGVASAKLASSMVTSVGFVSPVNDLIELMKSNGMRVASAERGEPMTGPEIARLVTPGVAYIKVRGSLAAQETGVTYTASFVHNQPAGGGRPDFPFGGMPMMPSQSSDNGKLHVTEFGEIDEYTGESQLPFVLGPVGMFFIERLDSFSESAWVHEEETMLFRIEKQESGPFGFHPRMNFGPPGMHGPFGQPEPDKVAETIPAIERTGWKTEQELNGKISLRKTYEFTTTPNPDRPYMKIRGSGTVVFDTAAGMPQSMEYDAVLESFQDSGSVRIPIHVSYTMRNPEDVRRERELAQKQQAEEQARLEKERTTPDAKVVDELLAAVKAAEGGMAASAPFSRLSEVAVVEDRRQKVLTVARRHAKNSNQFVQASAAAAFAHWATVNEFDDLIKIMDEDDHLLYDAQNKLVATLATFNDKRSYPVFLTALSRTFVAEEAKKAMIAVGPPIEDFILEQFNDLSEEKAKHGCLAVLKAIGTMKSETMLEKAATGSGGDFWVRKAAQEALDAIRSRE